MRTIIYTNQFKRDFKRIQKQNKDIEKLKIVIAKLAAGETLPELNCQLLCGSIRQCHCSCCVTWLLLAAAWGSGQRFPAAQLVAGRKAQDKWFARGILEQN